MSNESSWSTDHPRIGAKCPWPSGWGPEPRTARSRASRRAERPVFARRRFMERLRDQFLISSDLFWGNQNKNCKIGVNWQEEHCSAELKMVCNHNNKIPCMLHKHKERSASPKCNSRMCEKYSKSYSRVLDSKLLRRLLISQDKQRILTWWLMADDMNSFLSGRLTFVKCLLVP